MRWRLSLLAGMLGLLLLAAHTTTGVQPASAQPGQPAVPGADDEADDPPPNGDGALLAWRFQEGQRFGYKLTQSTSAKMIDRGREVTRDSVLTTEFQIRVQSVDDTEGLATIALTYTRVVFDQQSPLLPEPVHFDSDAEEDVQRAEYDPALKPFAALNGATFTLTIDLGGTVSDVAGCDEFLERLTDGLDNPAFDGLREALARQFSPEAMAALYTSQFALVPGEFTALGDTWTREFESEVEACGTVTVTREHTFKEIRHGAGGARVAVIGIVARFEDDGADSDAGSSGTGERDSDTGGATSALIPGYRFEGSIEEGEVRGEVLFDLTAGRPTSTSLRETFSTRLRATPLSEDAAALAFEAESTQTGTITLEALAGERDG